MKCIRTVPGRAVNPLFSRDEKTRVEAEGGVYDSIEFIDLPVGQIYDAEDAWKLCVLGKALPHDEECSKHTLAYLTSEKRQAIVGDIKLLREASKTNSLGEKDKRMLAMMERAYAVDLGLVPLPLTTTVTVPIKPAEPKIASVADGDV
jgi:hypothetical protein